ncbi:hypothetical protein L2E82_13413 [Cichorium intybus]|uniref:Uncharacterized protein n=1 Tax=Cichorium intybus TaxID=13427 RepID=A0ACB9EXR5_CICIN|nr:hypothetical protein L2E82_13413 [Cichorium intybus]
MFIFFCLQQHRHSHQLSQKCSDFIADSKIVLLGAIESQRHPSLSLLFLEDSKAVPSNPTSRFSATRNPMVDKRNALQVLDKMPQRKNLFFFQKPMESLKIRVFLG